MRCDEASAGKTPRSAMLLLALALAATACTRGSATERSALPAGHGGTLRALMAQTGGTPYGDPGAYDPQVANLPSDLEVARCCVFRTLMSYSGRPTSEGGAIARPDLAAREPS